MKPVRFKFKFRYLLIIAVAALLLGNRGFRNLVRNYREYRRLTADKARLEGERKDLERQLKDVGAAPAVEQAARRELGLIKPQETEYRFPPPKESDR